MDPEGDCCGGGEALGVSCKNTVLLAEDGGRRGAGEGTLWDEPEEIEDTRVESERSWSDSDERTGVGGPPLGIWTFCADRIFT